MNIKTLLSILAIAVALFVAWYPYFSGSYNLDKAIIMTQAFIISVLWVELFLSEEKIRNSKTEILKILKSTAMLQDRVQ